MLDARRIIKILHTLGSIGLAGGLAAFMMVLAYGPGPEMLSEYAELRGSLAVLSRWLILPAMVATLTSGLLSMAVHFPFQDKGWVWVKALLGLLVFEASLASIDGPARAAAAASASAAAGEIDAARLVTLIDDKWGAWWMLLAIFVVNVILGIWRPRFIKPVPAER
jgi:hypothetical protein